MSSLSQPLVHHLLASRLQIEDGSIEDAHSFEELGLNPLDLVLVVLRLEDSHWADGEFPLAALDQARTVGDLVALVELWLQNDAIPSSFQVRSTLT